MANYNSLQMTPPTYPVSGPGMGGRNVHISRASFTLSAALPVADTITLLRLHPRFRVVGASIKGSLGAGVTVNVGIAATPALFFAAAAVATGVYSSAMASAGYDYLTTGYTTVIATLGGATTAATGDLTVMIEGYIEEPA